MEDFSELFTPAIAGVVQFARRIPGFAMLSQDDQATLLKVSFPSALHYSRSRRRRSLSVAVAAGEQQHEYQCYSLSPASRVM